MRAMNKKLKKWITLSFNCFNIFSYKRTDRFLMQLLQKHIKSTQQFYGRVVISCWCFATFFVRTTSHKGAYTSVKYCTSSKNSLCHHFLKHAFIIKLWAKQRVGVKGSPIEHRHQRGGSIEPPLALPPHSHFNPRQHGRHIGTSGDCCGWMRKALWMDGLVCGRERREGGKETERKGEREWDCVARVLRQIGYWWTPVHSDAQMKFWHIVWNIHELSLNIFEVAGFLPQKGSLLFHLWPYSAVESKNEKNFISIFFPLNFPWTLCIFCLTTCYFQWALCKACYLTRTGIKFVPVFNFPVPKHCQAHRQSVFLLIFEYR